jgi:hypothetical protein
MSISVHYLLINISKDEWLRYYSREATHIQSKSLSGQTIRISAHHFRKFTTTSGIQGFFKLTLNGSQFSSIERI